MLRGLFEKLTTVSGSAREDARMIARQIARRAGIAFDLSGLELFKDIRRRAQLTHEALDNEMQCPDRAVGSMKQALTQMGRELQHAEVIHNLRERISETWRRQNDELPAKMAQSRNVGRVIAGGVQHGIKAMTLSEEQRELLKSARLTERLLLTEMVALGAFSADWAIVVALQKAPILDEVRSGYIDQWKEFSSTGEREAQAYKAFIEHADDYGRACQNVVHQEEGVIGSPVVDAFCRHLEASLTAAEDTPERTGYLYTLSSLTALPIHEACVGVAASVLKEAGMIR